jgi:oligogalacturonide lyase
LGAYCQGAKFGSQIMKSLFVAILTLFGSFATRAVAGDPPREWIDKATGHRIVRLSDKAGQMSFYFHQNGYTKEGDKMVFYAPNGLLAHTFKTRSNERIVDGTARHAVVGKKSRKVYYLKDDTAYETDIDTKVTRIIARDARLGSGSGFAINADETMLGGSMITGTCPPEFLRPKLNKGDYPGKGAWMDARLAAKIPMSLYTLRIRDGKLTIFHTATDWLNHVQFSPTDPGLMMFCHEGAWHKVDRIWTIRTDGGGLKKIHSRTMEQEIAGHEFFSPDGRFIYYDLQTPKGKVFWLARHDIKTGKSEKCSLAKREWSVHYNVSPDGTLFCGDGGGPGSVARGDNGQWIYLFRPKNGKIESEKLVNLSAHDYGLEPNATFTPDGKWLVFRSNMFGCPHVFAVEIQRAVQ